MNEKYLTIYNGGKGMKDLIDLVMKTKQFVCIPFFCKIYNCMYFCILL